MSLMRINSQEIRDADVFANLLESFPDIIHSVDDNGRIVFTNKAAERLLGYTRAEILGMHVRELYADEVLRDMERGFQDLKQRGDKLVKESLLKARDGTRIPVEIRSFSIYDDDGRFLRSFSILRDIRPIKALQESLVHAGRLAAIGELASGVAHDINNPLTVISLSNELIQRELGRDDADAAASRANIARHAEHITRASLSIQKLSEHLRNFSRAMVDRYERVDLAASVADALFIIDNKLKSNGVRVENNVPPGRHFVLGSANHLEQVLVNLIGNACDAMKGQPVRTLTLDVSPAGRDGQAFWRLAVTDTGTGIPEELREEIFRSFFTTKEKGKGTGLGLSIARGIVRDMKGDIELRSAVGQGSTFAVLLLQFEEAGAPAGDDTAGK